MHPVFYSRIGLYIRIEGVENILELSREFEQKEEKRIKEKNKNTWIVAGILAMLMVFGVSVYYKATEPDRDREALMQAQEEYRKAADEIEDIEAQIERNQRLIDQYEKK